MFNFYEKSIDLKIRRKFLAEAGVNLFTSGAIVLRPCDLYKFGNEPFFKSAIVGCNIYIIARRRRITIDPYTLSVSNGLIKGNFRVHDDDLSSYEKFRFNQRKKFTGHHGQDLNFVDVRIANSIGSEVHALDDSIGKVSYPAHVLISNSVNELGRATDLEVLYIGQAYGKSGERLATDRLQAHTTFQKILAESMEEKPYDELLLLLFRYEHSSNIASTAGDFSIEPSASGEEEIEHLKKVGAIWLDRKTRITLAEAALINYFKPKYNFMHVNSFDVDRKNKMKNLKTLKKLFSLDLSALVVEINTSGFGSKLYSTSAPAKSKTDIFSSRSIKNWESDEWLCEAGLSRPDLDGFIADMTHAHIASFPLYTKAERETFLHSLLWG